MSKDRYSDDYAIELFGVDKVYTIDSPNIILDAPPASVTTAFSSADASLLGGMFGGSIHANGSCLFNDYVGINGQLRVEGNSVLASEYIYVGNSSNSVSNIIFYPEGAEGGTPVTINGDLSVTGSIASASIGSTELVWPGTVESDSNMTMTSDGGSITLESKTDDLILDAAGYVSIRSNYVDGAAEGSNNCRVTLNESGRFQVTTNDVVNGTSRYRQNASGYAMFNFECDYNDDDYPEKYAMNVSNTDTAGGKHRLVRWSLSENSGASPGTELSTSADGADFFLRCIDLIDNANDSGGGVQFWIDGEGMLGISFTGQHWVIYEANGDEDRLSNSLCGMIVSSSGEIFNKPKLYEALPIVKMCNSSKDPKVYGVLTYTSQSVYDMRQFREFDGIYHEDSRGELSPEIDVSSYSSDSLYYKSRVNSVGEGQVLVTNYNGEVTNGDYITSSEIVGYGMKQDDDILHSYTVAKCVEEIDWASVTDVVEYDGVEHKMYLSACTYHCG